jgi:hypothetical protein
VKKSYKLKTSDKVQIDELERYLSPIILDEAEEYAKMLDNREVLLSQYK